MRSSVLKMVAAAAAVVAIPATAGAAVTLGTVTPGAAVYAGPAPTYNFDPNGTSLVSAGSITSTNLEGVRAKPLGSTGNYWSVGPTEGNPGVLDLSAIGDIFSVSFIWGSVDAYNKIEFLDASNVVLGSFTGSDIFYPANGNQTDPNLNPVVMFNVTGDDVTKLAKLRLTSTSNAFETDNYAINAVPEPGTWALMVLGFGLMGFGMRRRRHFVSPQFA